MRTVTSKDYQRSLSNIAKLYLGIGYSVIPIYGDSAPDKVKIAAINWKMFQMRRASDQFIDHWFESLNYSGLAIVTGRISNLIVVDFDSEEVEEAFRQKFSYLLNTRIVKSAGRGLSHYYYRMSPDINISTQRIQGADLLSDGAYVIAPPTIIAGKTYEIVNGGQPYQLTKNDTQHLIHFFKNRRNANCNNLPSPSTTLPKSITVPTETEHCLKTSPESLIHLYSHYAPQIGRNNALFKVACHGRDNYLSQLDVSNALQTYHADYPSHSSHTTQSYHSRIQEADRTIESAFSQPPRPHNQVPTQLTNSIREALLKLGLTCVARVLDGLFLNGFKSGDIITKKIVCDALKGKVGRHSILTTFSTIIKGEFAIFEHINPSPRTPTHTSVAKQPQKQSNKKCFLFSTTKSDKILRGRIPEHFRIPDINFLCSLLNVPFTRSDPLEDNDIQQAKTYRQAIHRELIKRRPGMYHRHWLANRLGVSKRTCQRYDIAVHIQRQPMYIRKHITWDTLHIIPTEDPIDGQFLEGKGGKRYPGLRQIAVHLLSQKQLVHYCYQDMNYYWYGDNLPLMSVRWGVNPKQELYDEQCRKIDTRFKQYWDDFKAKKHIIFSPTVRQKTVISQHQAIDDEPIDRQTNLPPKRVKSKRFYKKPLSDNRAETLSQRLYQAVWNQATEDSTRLSLINARHLVDTYSEALIHRVLGVLKYRQTINNPAGFVVVWLRSTAKGIGQ